MTAPTCHLHPPGLSSGCPWQQHPLEGGKERVPALALLHPFFFPNQAANGEIPPAAFQGPCPMASLQRREPGCLDLGWEGVAPFWMKLGVNREQKKGSEAGRGTWGWGQWGGRGGYQGGGGLQEETPMDGRTFRKVSLCHKHPCQFSLDAELDVKLIWCSWVFPCGQTPIFGGSCCLIPDPLQASFCDASEAAKGVLRLLQQPVVYSSQQDRLANWQRARSSVVEKVNLPGKKKLPGRVKTRGCLGRGTVLREPFELCGSPA